MISNQISLEEVAVTALGEAKKLECSDVSVICSRSNDGQVRFANNEITLVNSIREVTLDVYLAKSKKRIVGTTYNPTEQGIKKFVNNLVRSCESLPSSEDYVSLPQGPFKYSDRSNFDSKIADAPLVDFVKQAIDQGLKGGAVRISGSLNTESNELYILTSAGAKGSDRRSQILLNARAFKDDNSSGHGLSCTSFLSEFQPEQAGWKAGDYAKRSANPKQIPDGVYDVIFTPTVVANILPIASNASAFAIESGNSFLNDKLGQKVAMETMDIEDHGVYERGLGGRVFDDEGVPTNKNLVLSKGIFRTMLHNSTTAKKFGTKTTGNAGIIVPGPFTIVFSKGDSTLEEMIRSTKQGILITNNWYTRYQNIRTGEYSTVPRDAAFRIESGELKEPLSGLRVSDSIPRQLVSIDMVSKEREWIRWWEVSTPTFAPSMRVTGVHITRAVGS